MLNGIPFDVLFAAIEDVKRLNKLLIKISNGGAGQLDE